MPRLHCKLYTRCSALLPGGMALCCCSHIYVIVELGAAIESGSPARVKAAYDAFGVAFLTHTPSTSPQFAWLCFRAASLRHSAETIIGPDWQAELPLAATVLNCILESTAGAGPCG